MTRILSMVGALWWAVGLAACGGDTQARPYPDADSAQERGASGGESEPVQRSRSPDRGGGPHPTDDEMTGESMQPL